MPAALGSGSNVRVTGFELNVTVLGAFCLLSVLDIGNKGVRSPAGVSDVVEVSSIVLVVSALVGIRLVAVPLGARAEIR